MPKPAVRGALVALVYVVACRVMLAPIFNFGAMKTASYAGDARLVAWALAWDNHATASRLPLFDANIFYPTTAALAYGEHFFGISLFTLPLYLTTRNPILAYNLVWLLSYVLTALSGHYLVWRLTRDHLASVVAGLAFAFSFFRMHHGHGHLHLLWVFWIPVALVAMERWLLADSWRWLWLFVLVVVLQALSSWYQAILIFVATASFALWLLVLQPLSDGGPWRSLPQMRRIAVQAVVGAAAALAAIWPFARHYSRLASGGPVEAAANSADVAGYLIPPQNTWIGRWLMQHDVKGPRWIWGELTLYVGWITLALAFGGALVAVRGRTAQTRALRFFIVLAVVALALAAGPNAREIADNRWHWSAFGVLAHIPGADLFRAPARFALLLTLAMAALAGGFCAHLHERYGRYGRIFAIVAIPFLLSEFFVVDFPGGQPRPTPIPAVYRKVAALPPAPLVSLPDYAATSAWYDEPDYQLFSTVHWRPIANGYSRAAPSDFSRRMARLSAFPNAPAIDEARHLGIRYVILHTDKYPGGPDAAERAMRAANVRLLARFRSDYLFEIQTE